MSFLSAVRPPIMWLPSFTLASLCHTQPEHLMRGTGGYYMNAVLEEIMQSGYAASPTGDLVKVQDAIAMRENQSIAGVVKPEARTALIGRLDRIYGATAAFGV